MILFLLGTCSYTPILPKNAEKPTVMTFQSDFIGVVQRRCQRALSKGVVKYFNLGTTPDFTLFTIFFHFLAIKLVGWWASFAS